MENIGNGGGGGNVTTALVGVAVQLVPGIIEMIRAKRAADDPNAPTVSDAEVLEALDQAVKSSIAKDDVWLAAHPEPPGGDSPF